MTTSVLQIPVPPGWLSHHSEWTAAITIESILEHEGKSATESSKYRTHRQADRTRGDIPEPMQTGSSTIAHARCLEMAS
jgi:hypothetical protein